MRVRGQVADLEAEVDRPNLLCVKGQRVAAASILCLKEHDILALLMEQEGGRKAADASTDDGNALALLTFFG